MSLSPLTMRDLLVIILIPGAMQWYAMRILRAEHGTERIIKEGFRLIIWALSLIFVGIVLK